MNEHIRKLNLSQDLPQVADLIELCFPIHKDQDGKAYVREMRKAARDMRMVGWLSSLAVATEIRSSGFVWEEGGKIVGNLSLIPLKKDGRRIHLIANVAVHPDQRRRGIARALTDRALVYLVRANEPNVWLQVRDDNQAAIDLYHSSGFVEQTARTTWRIRPFELEPPAKSTDINIRVRHRKMEDWGKQRRLLFEAYPPEIRWNLPVNFRRFEPGIIQMISNLMDNEILKHWVYRHEDNLGYITWQKTTTFADNVWLAFPEESERLLLPPALAAVCKRLSRSHPISVDYPKGRAESVFSELGFEHFRTLIWMKRQL